MFKLDGKDIYITKLEDDVDMHGVPFLKCKGRVYYRKESKSGKLYLAMGILPSVRLYGDEELFEETKKRLFGQTIPYPKLKLNMISADFEIYYDKNKKTNFYNLYVYAYDFPSQKYGTRRKNKAKAKAELERLEVIKELAEPNEFEV